MPTKTTNYNLVKPSPDDFYDIEVQNSNMDIIDAELKKNADEVAGKASTAVATQANNGLMSSADKTKLDSVEQGANKYIHPATHPPSIIAQDVNNRFVTDSEKQNWNGKASTAVATQAANGLMSSADKTKLDGVEQGANKYTHPATHPPSIIAQDTNNRFVTDAEKQNWNGKQAALPVENRRKITYGTTDPTGGVDGDIYFQYE